MTITRRTFGAGLAGTALIATSRSASAEAYPPPGQTIKFSFRVNDNAGVGCLELARGRSVSKQNFPAFRVDWIEHWANEVEFGFER